MVFASLKKMTKVNSGGGATVSKLCNQCGRTQ